jgi:hypothetical protein
VQQCGGVWQCGSALCAAVRAAVCDNALGRMRQCGSACMAVRQCLAVRQWVAVQECAAVRQCAAVHAAVGVR